MDAKQSQVVDKGDLHKYRTELPNLIDDMDLSVYAYRLYGRLKRVAGDAGQCWQSTATLAAACHMSAGSVLNAKRELMQKRLIRIEKQKRADNGFDTDLITIVDIWLENFIKYAPARDEQETDTPPYTPHEEGTTPREKATTPREKATTPREKPSTPRETKKNPIKKEPIKNNGGETPPSFTEGQKYFLRCWKAKSFKTAIQHETILRLEKQYGTERLKEVINWAAKKGMTMGDAITSIETAIPTWGTPKTSQPPAPSVPPVEPHYAEEW